MTNFNPQTLFVKVSGVRPIVVASRAGCKTEFAESLHDALLQKLDEMIVDLEGEIITWREASVSSAFSLYYEPHAPFEARWILNGPISLLDPISTDVISEGEREACRVGLAFTEVPANELEGLADILETIALETGVRFVAARVPSDSAL